MLTNILGGRGWLGIRDRTCLIPTYSLQAQGNEARLGNPIPVIYGRHLIYPDFARVTGIKLRSNKVELTAAVEWEYLLAGLGILLGVSGVRDIGLKKGQKDVQDD